MSTYKVTSVNDPLDTQEVEADSVRIDEATNATIFLDKQGNPVARFYNVSFARVAK